MKIDNFDPDFEQRIVPQFGGIAIVKRGFCLTKASAVVLADALTEALGYPVSVTWGPPREDWSDGSAFGWQTDCGVPWLEIRTPDRTVKMNGGVAAQRFLHGYPTAQVVSAIKAELG